MEQDKIEELIRKAESDEALKRHLKDNRTLTSGLLDDLGKIMELKDGNSLVEVRLKDKAKSSPDLIDAFRTLFAYVEQIEALRIPRFAKGYILRKLGAIATVKIKKEDQE